MEQLPLVLSSLALADTLARRPSQNLIVGVQSHEDLHLCQQLHHLCWLDDLKTIPYQVTQEAATSFNRESTQFHERP